VGDLICPRCLLNARNVPVTLRLRHNSLCWHTFLLASRDEMVFRPIQMRRRSDSTCYQSERAGVFVATAFYLIGSV
jgi:hypothetical protein